MAKDIPDVAPGSAMAAVLDTKTPKHKKEPAKTPEQPAPAETTPVEPPPAEVPKEPDKPVETIPPKPEKNNPDVRIISFQVPYGGAPEGYCQHEVHVSLDHKHAVLLRRICDGLRQKRAILSSGRTVVSPEHALRWLLEEAGKQIPKVES